MLEAFLETVCEHEKRASAEGRMQELLDKLPTPDLQKIASGMTLKQAFFHESGDWLEKYKDSPLLQEAIALERECLEQQMESNARRRENDVIWREDDMKRDELAIRRKLLDLQLAEAEGAGEEAGDVAEDVVEEAGGSEEQAEEAEEEAEETAAADQGPEDLGKAAAAMRFDMAAARLGLTKEALTQADVVRRVAAAAKKATPERLAKAQHNLEQVNRRATSKMMGRLHGSPGSVRSAAEQGAKAHKGSSVIKKELVSRGVANTAPVSGVRPRAAAKPPAREVTTRPLQSRSAPTRAEPTRSAPTRVKSPPNQAATKAESPKSIRAQGGGISRTALGLGVGAAGGAMAMGQDKSAAAREARIKAAFAGALMSGLKGMKNFAGAAGKSIAGAAQTGGAQAAGQAAMNAGRAGAHRAGNFISKNPAAGAALVAAPAAAAGYAAG